MTENLQNHNQSEEQLTDVTGGNADAASGFYWSGKNPKFYQGQRVIVRTAPLYDVTEYHKAVITKVGGKTGGHILKEFVYTVRYDNGTTEDDIYESQLPDDTIPVR